MLQQFIEAHRVLIADLLAEIEDAVIVRARDRNIHLCVHPAQTGLAVVGDSRILASVVTHLAQNACKHSRAHGSVTVRVAATRDRVLIEVTDECGGLTAGAREDLFGRRGPSDGSLRGSGLPNSLRGAQAVGGELSVRDVPGTGCIFTLDLQRSTPGVTANERD
jgi:signal transduction histidine kinase